MCGIAGFVTFRRGIDVSEPVRLMSTAMERRGPDAQGFNSWPGAALGHRRLAILDLSPAGNQPMLSHDGQTGVVFNGCIYNFEELRRQLERSGEEFRSHCDTEVLLHGYRRWGIDDLVGRLHGMFAFAVWDNPRRHLTLVRDRLGVKPLVYWTGNGSIAFASTVGALRTAGFGGDIDPAAVSDFLQRGFVSDARSIYRELHKLPPATILEWQDGAISSRSYWSLPQPSTSIGFEEAVEETERRLIQAVRLRLVADVNVAALLSGGVDSALVCWALKQLNANVRAYTVGASGDISDESAAAKETASVLGVAHEVVELPENRPAPLEELQAAYSEPFASQSALGMLAVSQAIGTRAKVLLTGDGGDDVFLGYPFFRNARIAQIAAGFPAAARAAQALTRRVPGARRLNTLLNCATEGMAGFIRAGNRVAYYAQRGLIGAQLLDAASIELPGPSEQSARGLLPEVFKYHLGNHFIGEFMVKVDAASMYYGVEARSPLLDQSLWEFGAALPFSLRLHRWHLKAVLREICRRRIGPNIARRPKQGFTVPVERWLPERWSSHIAALRGETELVRQGWIRPGSLPAAVDAAFAEKRVPVQLWYLLVLENWLLARKSATVEAGVR